MIHVIPHRVSEGLRKENAVHEKNMTDAAIDRLAAQLPTLPGFLAEYQSTLGGDRFVRSLPSLSSARRIVDIGVGLGGSSIYLAAQGHAVTVVEPCLGMCRYVERAAESFGLKLDIWCLTAEGMDALPAAAFDHCIFNASLHHCDDPVQALLNCNRLLVPGGQVLLLNEPLLKIFVAKSSYYRRLEEKPEEMGHYGGNEHIYYHHEYIHMLRRTGFSKVRGDLASFYFAPRHQLALLKHQRVPPWRILARRIYYSLLRAIHFSGPAGRPALNLMRRLSVLATNFQATKQAA